ncbi:hypothetical protein SAMD00019534_035320 [Acytostelium subglobosum LB1]|uniref:hypothetical protein n=1 Tax=Acytostelium subglobosum LB1 TaxID=1410327 RepID=UPI0006449DBC|nr:hypothetical protein SAMD00019534_035320 [Acytostelium subglobosum LB1]GAM20357.1 hypothetical protein SAMD00019534_035320 [Acytostelium subglobosum LB1]|eukprot:XP_012759878.1 hypothetical protein SAMD00019534_035320 [Acytostelium subglobosum LB1]
MLFGIRLWISTVLTSYIDKTLISLNESLKIFFQEVWQLGVQLANMATITFLRIFYKPGYQSYLEQRHRIKKRNKSTSSSSSSLYKKTRSSPLHQSHLSQLYIQQRQQQQQQLQQYQHQQQQHYQQFQQQQQQGQQQQGQQQQQGNTKTPTPFVQLLNDPDGGSPTMSPSTSSYAISNDAAMSPQSSLSGLSGSGSGSSSSNNNSVFRKTLSSSLRPSSSSSKRNTMEPITPRPRSGKKKKRQYYVNRDLVHHHEQITTGFLEDLRTNILLFSDRFFHYLRVKISNTLNALASFSIRSFIFFLITFPLYLPYYIFKVITFPFTMCNSVINMLVNRWKRVRDIPNRLFSDKELDVRSVKEIVEQAGYPYEQYHVTTEDGYILLLERIPNKQSKHILYLQHGVFDNSFAWVATGPTQSLAFAAHDQGYDVFLGNLRGNGERLHTEHNISAKQYWDFSVNEHAFKDIPSFIQVIRQVKIKELATQNNDVVSANDINISAVAHSMGAACILMYIVFMGILKKSHHLSRVILLSPAGVHEKAPKIVDFLGPLINLWVSIFPVYVFKFPSDTIRVITAKIYHDLMSNTPTKDLMVYLVSRFLLGGEMKNHPLEKIHNLAYNTFSGTSVKTYRHFFQIRKAKKFQAFDYGKQKNMELYGTPYPLNFLDHYDVINIPVHFIMGLNDNLIEPHNIIKHYSTLKKFHPEFAFLKASKSGHIEFTLGLDDQILNYILNILDASKTDQAAI